MILLGLLATLGALVQPASPPPAKPLVLRGAKILPVSGPPLEGGIVLVSGGRIRAVGKDLAVPDDAVIVDLPGKVLVPGFIDAASRCRIQSGEPGPGAPDQDVLDVLDAGEPSWREARARGVTLVFLSPPGTGPVSGQGAVVALDDAGTVVARGAALRLSLASGESSSPAQRHAALGQVRALFEGARQHREAVEKHRKDLAEHAEKKKAAEAKKEEFKQPEPPAPKTDARMHVLLQVLDPAASMRVRVEVHAADSIEELLSIAAEYKVRLVLEEATSGGAKAEALAKAGIPVVVGPALRYGPADADHARFDPGLAAELDKKGVKVAIGSCSAAGGGPSRFLLEFAGLACASGMAADRALAAVTLEAARALGVEKEAGSIEAGKRADLVVLSGEPFEAGTRVDRVYVGGVPVHGGRE